MDPRVLGSPHVAHNTHIHMIANIQVSYQDRSRDRKRTGTAVRGHDCSRDLKYISLVTMTVHVIASVLRPFISCVRD